MNANQRNARHSRPERGFSLMEVMVGVAIGLIGMVVIFQVLEVWDARKRTTSSGSDAQIAGAIAMFNMERDIRQAGFGFGNATFMGCTVAAYNSARTPQNFTFVLSPVRIIDGAAGAPDQIVTLYGNSPFFTSSQTYSLSSATAKKSAGNASYQPGELVIAADAGGNCALVEVTVNGSASGLGALSGWVQHTTTPYTNYLSTPNVTPTRNDPAGTAGFSSGALYNLGPAPRLNTWQIQANNSLAWSDGLQATTSWSEVAEGIVNLQAQYGVDANNDNMIDSTEWTITAPGNWSTVRAIRVAILARSQQYEKTAVTSTTPSWSGGAFVMNNLDGTPDSTPDNANDWRHYRYRVFEQVIPLRNMIWGTQP